MKNEKNASEKNAVNPEEKNAAESSAVNPEETNAADNSAAPLEETPDLGDFKPRKVNISEFGPMTDQTLSTRAQTIVTAMTGNPVYDKPEPTLADITARNTAFKEACANFKVSGSEVNKGIRDNTRKTLLTGIRSLAAYVEVTSKGNPILIKSAEFTPYADRTDAQMPGIPLRPVFKQGKKLGEGKLSTAAYTQNSKRAKAVWRMSLDNGKTYISLPGFSAPTVITCAATVTTLIIKNANKYAHVWWFW